MPKHLDLDTHKLNAIKKSEIPAEENEVIRSQKEIREKASNFLHSLNNLLSPLMGSLQLMSHSEPERHLITFFESCSNIEEAIQEEMDNITFSSKELHELAKLDFIKITMSYVDFLKNEIKKAQAAESKENFNIYIDSALEAFNKYDRLRQNFGENMLGTKYIKTTR